MQRLIVFFDGTWNDPTDQTNVYRMASSIATEHAEVTQIFLRPWGGDRPIYQVSRRHQRIWSQQKPLQGYDWLARHHVEGDEIWIFGFSRGHTLHAAWQA